MSTDEIQTFLPIAYLFVALIGLAFGSFLTVVIYRYPIMIKKSWRAECREFLELEPEPNETFNLAVPRSKCTHCGNAIKFYHNIPVLSYLFLGGQCAYCKTHFSPKYLMIELTTVILSLLALWRFGLTWQTVAAIVFTYVLIALFFIDLETKLLPDTLTLSTLWLGLMINSFGLFAPLNHAVLSAACGYSFLWVTAWAFLKLRGKQGMGHGDFKMLAMVGAWFGFQIMVNTLLLAALLGTLISLLLLAIKKMNWKNPIPFGPFIAVGAWISLMAGHFLLNWIPMY